MKCPLTGCSWKKGILNWWQGGLLLAAAFFVTVLFVKPIGVSTQFVILNAMVWDAFDSAVIVTSEVTKTGYDSANAYLAKSGGKYAKNAANPLNYSFVFVVALVVGAWLSSQFGGDKPTGREKQAPAVWEEKFGQNRTALRYVVAFVAGFLVLYGARLAGGCTSGHMMSGMMQTSVSGYLFTLGLMGAAIPVAFLMYGKKGGQ